MNEYRDLKFGTERRFALGGRATAVAAAVALFALLSWAIPAERLFWPLAFALAALTWAATYGWRDALAALIRFLETLIAEGGNR